ncbi:hypothetical protein PMKS-000316 [Pichia membranifaciens]|uniref:Uncharacterized protein n=1 Tax=Pichia membranifaciens TaxID=4926 RepID=A0A1Q2YBD4_9ASCO|nr:hypothetical protein PMKS-000316 [Pichia membranifaciens]
MKPEKNTMGDFEKSINVGTETTQKPNANTNESNGENCNSKSSKPALVVEKPVVGSIDHLAISKSLGYQIFRKTRRNAWNADEDKCLKELLIQQHTRNNRLSDYTNEQIDIKMIDWFDIASKMKTKRKGKECKKRWVSSLDPFLRKGKWTKSEDEALIKAFKKHGASWQKVASEINGRNEDQCSKRYTEVLNSDTKERLKPWSLEEDLILIDQVKQLGTKWRQISSSLPSRPSLTCRNRWRKIMTDIAKDSASNVIKKAVGVLDENGVPTIKFKQSNQYGDENFNKVKPFQQERSKLDSKVQGDDNIEIDAEDDMTKKLKRKVEDDKETQGISKRQNSGSNTNGKKTPAPENFSTTTSYPRIETPVRTQTDWSFSLVDPRTNEELKSYTGEINTQELAHYLIELARFNGVTLTVHQHIHHHYSSSASTVSSDPQTNISRYGHFNYLPPLIEVPKLTSSSSPDNTVESSASTKNYTENPLLRLLNNDDGSNNTSNGFESNRPLNSGGSETEVNLPSKKTGTSDNDPKNNFLKSHRQQLHASRPSQYGEQSHNLEYSNSNSQLQSPGPTDTPGNKTEDLKDGENTGKSYTTEDLGEELDFWETMRSISRPKNNKPVSQHHPLHYYQPSNYKEHLPYQPSDSFGIQRFPNMATPLVTNMIRGEKNTKSVETSVTNVNTDESYGGMYMEGENDDAEEEEEIDIANQYGLYYNVFANKSQANYGSYGKQQNNSVNSGAVDLVNSGYLMPFNPS